MTPAELLCNLQGMLDRANSPAPVLKAIGDLMVASADRNFEAEGRPAWTPTHRHRAAMHGRRSSCLCGDAGCGEMDERGTCHSPTLFLVLFGLRQEPIPGSPLLQFSAVFLVRAQE